MEMNHKPTRIKQSRNDEPNHDKVKQAGNGGRGKKRKRKKRKLRKVFLRLSEKERR